MFKHFVPAEFYNYPSWGSWLKQFEYAMSIRVKYPNKALMYLIDTDYERWKSICDEIDNIDRVAEAIEFLGKQLDTQRRCCQPQYHRIENVIQIAKLAAFERRNAKLRDQLKEAQDQWHCLSTNLEILETTELQFKSVAYELQKRLNELSKEDRSRLTSLQQNLWQVSQREREVELLIAKLTTKINIFQKCLKMIRPKLRVKSHFK